MIAIPPYLDPEAWSAFIEMRKKIKKPLTDYAAKLVLGKLQKIKDAGGSPQEALEQSIMNCWSGIWPVKVAKASHHEQKTFAERDSEARAARIHEITGGLMGKKRPSERDFIDMEPSNGRLLD